MQHSKQHIDELKSRLDIVNVIGSFIKLKKNGKSFEACCPFHEEDTPSFSIHPGKQMYKCFGCGKGGDVISFVEEYKHIPFMEAVKYLEEIAHLQPSIETQKNTTKKIVNFKDQCTLISPIPDTAILPTLSPPRLVNGTFRQFPITLVSAYRDCLGNPITYDMRFELPKKKEVCPLSYCKTPDGREEWIWAELHKPSPLYNFDLMIKHPDWDIVIVEGCKCARALQDFFFTHNTSKIAISWRGGRNLSAVKKADWDKLKNKNILIWPDFDWQPYKSGPKQGQIMPLEEQGGFIAALKIYEIVQGSNKITRVIKPQSDKPDGWDCYDAIHSDPWKWSIDQVLAFMSDNLVDNSNPDTVDTSISFFDEAPFTCLGYDGEFRYYLANNTGRVKAIKDENHGWKSLITIASKDFYKQWFPHKFGADWEDVASFLLNCKESRKSFNPRKLRGRGAWIDRGRIVVHLGDRLIVDNVQCTSFRIKDSDFIYEEGVPIEDNIKTPLVTSESQKLLDIIEQLNFSSQSHAPLLAGFCALGPICGALAWRPHLWITGGKGTGKTTIMRDIVNQCIGPFLLPVKGKSTASGICQTNKLDALTIAFDESESRNKKAKARLDDILDLARVSSSESDGREVRGTSVHKAVEFDPRSMFVFSSIGVNISNDADESRISLIELIKPRGISQKDLDNKWALLDEQIHSLLTPEYCASLRARSIFNIKIIRKNCIVFSRAVSEHLCSKRAGDQLGTLFAGAFSLASDTEITPDGAKAWIQQFDFSTVYDDGHNEEQNLLDYLLQHTIKIDTSNDLSVEEMVQKITNASNISFEADCDQEKMAGILKRIGIRIERDTVNKTKWTLWIANSHSGIAKILEETEWPKKWGILLKRLPGAEQRNMRYTGSPTMSTGIPWIVD